MRTEKLIAAAILGDDKDKEKALRQLTCKTAASHAMVCECGAIHDMKKIHVIEIVDSDGMEQTLAACCPACFAKHCPRLEAMALKAGADYRAENMEPSRIRVATWKEFIVLPCE